MARGGYGFTYTVRRRRLKSEENNYLATSPADSAGTFIHGIIRQRAARSLSYGEGGGRWHVRPRVIYVPLRRKESSSWGVIKATPFTRAPPPFLRALPARAGAAGGRRPGAPVRSRAVTLHGLAPSPPSPLRQEWSLPRVLARKLPGLKTLIATVQCVCKELVTSTFTLYV